MSNRTLPQLPALATPSLPGFTHTSAPSHSNQGRNAITMRPNKLTPQPTNTEIERFHATLEHDLLPKVLKATGPTSLVHFSRPKGVPTLKLLADQRGRSPLTLTRKPDGTLRVSPDRPHSALLLDRTNHISDFVHQVTVSLYRETLTRAKSRKALFTLATGGQEQALHTALLHWGTQAAKILTSTATLPTKTKPVALADATQTWNKLVRAHFLDKELADTAASLLNTGKSSLTHHQYNFILRNLKVITNHSDDHRFLSLLTYFGRHLAHLRPDTHFSDPAHLATIIADIAGVPHRLHPHLHAAVGGRTSMTSLHFIAPSCYALDTLPTDTNSADRSTVGRYGEQSHAAAAHGPDAWQHWTNALLAYTQDHDHASLARTADAITQLPPATIGPVEPVHPHQPANPDPITQHLTGPAKDVVTAASPPWTPATIRTSANTVAVSILTSPDGKNAITVTRNPDGTLTTNRPPPTNLHTPFLPTLKFQKDLLTTIATELLQHTYKHIPSEFISAFDHQYTIHRYLRQARDTAQQIAQQLLTTQDPQDINHFTNRTNALLRRYILDPTVLELTVKLFSTGPNPLNINDLTLFQYNTTALNLPIFQQLTHTSQTTALVYYCIHLADTDRPPQRLDHPGQLVQIVRQALDLTDRQWPYFLKAAIVSEEHKPRTASTARWPLACQALADANRPRANPLAMTDVFLNHREHAHFRNANWDHGDAWNAWTSLINRYLEPSQQPKTQQDLLYITDALVYHVDHQLPWGPGTWETLYARAQRWHTQHFQGRPDRSILPQAAAQSTWDSLLPETIIDRLRFAPLTSGLALSQTGSQMYNCLPNYWHRCLDNTSRIFTVSSPTGTLLAAVEITNTDGIWRRRQIEAPHRGRIPRGVKNAASKLAKAYQQAQDDSKTVTP